jgi:succinate dehydrogenase assembly factor 1
LPPFVLNPLSERPLMAVGAARHSGLQLQVLTLYRSCLRIVRSLPPAARSPAALYAREEFRRFASVDRFDHQRVEHLLRAGKKKLSLVTDVGVTGFALTGGARGGADAGLLRAVRAG